VPRWRGPARRPSPLPTSSSVGIGQGRALAQEDQRQDEGEHHDREQPELQDGVQEDGASRPGQLGELRREDEDPSRGGDQPDDEEGLGCERVLAERDLDGV
jgi:hypothetical protein